MIHKTIIVLLMLAAVSVGIADFNSSEYPGMSSENRTIARLVREKFHLQVDSPSAHRFRLTLEWVIPNSPARQPDHQVETPLGFGWYARRIIHEGVTWKHVQLESPGWALVAALIAYPTIAFIRGPLRRWRRRRKGRCLKCGYNLTGNVSGVCPECGTEVRR